MIHFTEANFMQLFSNLESVLSKYDLSLAMVQNPEGTQPSDMHTSVISQRLNCSGDKYSGILAKETNNLVY